MLRVKRLDHGARLPSVAHPGEDLGYDLFALQDVALIPGSVVKVRTGIAVEARHPETGVPLSVSPLTWSHSTFVECVMSYLARLADLRRCEKCGSSTFSPAG